MFEFRSENPILDIYRRYLADKVLALSNEGMEAADVVKEEHYTGANNITLPSVADLENYLQQADSEQQFSLRDEFPPSSDYDAADEQSPDANEDKETLENKPVTIGIRPSALLADLQVSVNEQLVERQSQQSSLAENSIDTEQDTDFEIDKGDLEKGLQALQSAQNRLFKSIVPDGFSDIYAEYVQQKAKSGTEASVDRGSLLVERTRNLFSAIANPKDHNLRGATGMLQRHQLDGMELPSTHEMDAYCKGQDPGRELWQDGSNVPLFKKRFTPDKIDQLTDDMLATPGLSSDQYQALVRRMGADQVVDRFCDTENPLSLCPDAIAALNNGDNAPSEPNRQRMIERLCQKPMTRDAATALASIQTKKIPEEVRDAVKNSLSKYLKAFSNSNDHKSQVLDQDEYAHLLNVFDQYSQLSLTKKERQDKDKISKLFYALDLNPAFIRQLPRNEKNDMTLGGRLTLVLSFSGAVPKILSVGALSPPSPPGGALVTRNGLPPIGSSSSMVPYTPYNNGSVLPIDLGDHSVFPGVGNDFYGRSPNQYQNLFDFPKGPVLTEFRPLEDFTPSKPDENAFNIAPVTDTPPVQSTRAPNASKTTQDTPPGQPTRVQAKTKIIEADMKLNSLATLLDSATDDSSTVTKIKMAINEIAPSNATASDLDQPSVLMTDAQQNKFTQLKGKAPLIIEKLQTKSRHATQNFFDKLQLADSLEALNPNSNAYKACLQNAKDNETQEDFKQQEQALIDRLPDQISYKLDVIKLSSSYEQQKQLQALQEQINTAPELSENSTINKTIADYGQQVEQALAHLDQQSLMTEYQSRYDKLANQEPAEAIAGLDLLITTLESEISENKLPDDAETLKTDATERLTEKLEAQTPVTLDEEGLDGLAERQAAIQAESNPRFKTLLKDALNARVKAHAGQIKQSMASDSSRVSKTTIKQLTSLLNASNDIDTQSSIISQLGKAFQGLGTSIVNKGASLDVKKSPEELSQFKSMIDQNNEVIKFIQDNESPLASEPSLFGELLKGFARDSDPGMPKSDMERLDHALLTARTHFSRLVQSKQAADRILNDKTTELIQNQVKEALPDLQEMSPEAINKALNLLSGQTSTSLQKQEPTVANQLDQAKHDALTTKLEEIDKARETAETAVEIVDTQVEEAQSPQELQDIRRSISEKITPDPVTGTDQAQNAVYQAALNKVDEKIEQFQTNQQNLNTAIENLPEIPEQSEQPLPLTEQNVQIKALFGAIQFVNAAQQKPGTELNDKQRQKINAQENWLESLQSTFGQGQQAVENIRALTDVNETGVIKKSSDSPKLVEVVNAHKAVVERRKQLKSSQTQAAIGLDSNLGEPVKQAIKTLDARRDALEDDYVKLQTKAYESELTAIQEGVSSGSSVQGAFKALQEAASMLIGSAKDSNAISSLDNDIHALDEKNEAIKLIPTSFEQYDNILTSRSAKNATDESDQELCVELSGQLAAMGEKSIAANQEKIDALKIQKGILRAQQFADDKLKPKNDDSDLDAWVSRVATIQSQLKDEMLVDNDEKITQGYQEQLGITLAADIQSLTIAYTHYADKNEGLINSKTRQGSIKNMTPDQLEAAQANLTLMKNALALQTDGNPILEIDGQSLNDTLRAVTTAIAHRERLHGDLKILDSIPEKPEDQIGVIQYANELLRTENDVDAISVEHLQKVAGKAIVTCQNALLPSASTAVFAQKGAQDWLEGVLGGEAKAPPAFNTLFTEEQKQLLNSVQQLGSIKNTMAAALTNDASDVAFTNAAEALKAYDTADKFKNHVDDISNALPEGADLKQQLAGLTEQYSQVQTRLQTYAEDRNRVQAYQGNHNAWNESLSAALESPSVSVEGLETLLSQKPELPTLSELSRGVTIDQSNSNLEEQAQDVISKVNEQLPAVDEKSALSALSDAHMTQLRNQNTSPEIEKSLSDVGQDSLQGRMLSNRRTTNNAKLKAEFMTRDRLKRSFDQQIGLQRPTDERNLGETLVKMDAENLKELQASLDKPNDAITKIIEAGKGETDRDARTDYLKGYSEDLRRQISGQLEVRQQAVKTTQATLNETVRQIQNDFPLNATDLKNPTEVAKARALLSDALRDYGNACGRAGVQVPESDQSEDNPDVGPVSVLRAQLQTYSDMYALNRAILEKRNGIAPADMKEADLAAYKEALQGIKPAQESPDAVKNLYDAEITAIDDAESSLNKLRQQFINDVVGYTPVVADEKGDPAQVPSSDVVDDKGHSTKALSDALQNLYNQVHSESVDEAKAKLRDAVSHLSDSDRHNQVDSESVKEAKAKLRDAISQLSDSDRLSLNKSLSRLDTELVRPGNQYIKLDQSAREIQTLMRKQLNRVKNAKKPEQDVEKFYKKAFNDLDGKNANAKTLDDLSGAQLRNLRSVLSDKIIKYRDEDKIGLMQKKIAAVETQLTEREKAYDNALKANDVALNESQPDNSQLALIEDVALGERIEGLRGRIVEFTKLADRAGIEDDDRIAIQGVNDTLNALQAEQSARTDYAGYIEKCDEFDDKVLALEKERLDASTVSACEKIDKQFGNLNKPEPIATNKLPAGKRVLIKPRDIEETDPRIAHVEARNTKMSEISEAIGKAVILDGDLASASIEALQASDKIMQEQSEEQTKLINDKKYKSIQSFEDLEPLVTAQDHDARIQAIKNVLRYYEGLETRINECETQEALDAISLNDLSGVIDQDQDDPIDPNQHDIAVKKTQLAALKTQKSEQLSNISGMGAEDALAQSVVKEEQAARIIQQAQRVNMESIVENLKQINETAAALDENSWFLVKNRDQLEPVATLFTGQNNATSETHVKINQAVGVANSLNRYIDSANNSVVSTSSNVNKSTPVNSNSSDASKLDGPSEDEQALITKVAGYLRDPTPESAPTPAETLQAIKTAENNTDVAQRLRGAYAENQQKPENTGAPGTDDEQSPYNFIAAALLGAGVLLSAVASQRSNTPNTPNTPNTSRVEDSALLTADGARPQVNPDTMDCAVRVTCFLDDNTRHVKKYNYVEEGHGFEEIKAKSNEDLSPGSSVKSVEGKWNPADPNDRNVEEAAYRAAKAFLNNNTRQKMTMPACDATKRQIVLKGVSRCIDDLKKEENTAFNPKARLGASLLRELSKAARTSNQNRLSALQVRGQENVEGAKKALTKVNTTNGNQSNTPTVKEIPGANGK